MKKKILFLFLTVISVLAIIVSTGAVAAFADNDETVEIDTGFVNEGASVDVSADAAPLYNDISEFKKVASTSAKELYMLDVKNKAVVFAVKDIASGSILYSVPADCTKLGDAQAAVLSNHVVLNYLDAQSVSQSANASDAIAAGDYKLESIENGVRITYVIQDVKKIKCFTVPMTFTLKDDHFDVSVEMNKIVVDASAGNSLLTLSVMPYFGCAEYTDDGYIFVPDGSGALIENDFTALDGLSKTYSTEVYGRDLALSLSLKLGYTEATTMPVFGTKAGDSAWLGIIDTGDAVAMVKAQSARESFPYTQSYCEFMYNKKDTFQSKTSRNIKDYVQTALEHTDLENATVRFYGLSGDKADYIGMAKTYRDYLVEYGTGSEVSADLPFYAEILGAFQRTESVLGFITDVTKSATTFEEATAIINTLSELGVKNINARYIGWLNGGTDTSMIKNSKHESVLGSKQELIDFNKAVEAQGGTTFLDVELIEKYKTSLSWSANKLAVRNILNNHAEQYIFSRNIGMPNEDLMYYLCRPQYFQTQIDNLFKNYADYGVKGISTGTLASANYSDMNNSAKVFRDAQQVNDAAVSALASIKENMGEQGKVMVTSGNSSMLPYADVVVGAPMYSNGYEVTYTDVPFLQIALHGLVTYTETAHNLCNDPQTQLLRQLETGTVPYYLFTQVDSSAFVGTRLNYIYTSQIDTWKDSAAANYKALASVLNGYCDKEITNHVIITDDVRATTYGNERVVVVNYGSKPYALGSFEVEGGAFTTMTVEDLSIALGNTAVNGGDVQ